MEIKKFNDMKAYLLKPKRLFTSKQDTIGGGIIQGEDLGSRIGFSAPVQLKATENKGKWKVRYRDKKFGRREGETGYKEGDKFFDTKEEADAFYEDLQSKKEKKKAAGITSKNIAVEKQAKEINNFVDDFINKNITNYGVRDYDEFKKNLLESFKKSNIKDSSGRQALYKGLPNTGIKEAENHFKKLFYTSKLETDDVLRNNIDRYLDYNNIDKKYYKGTYVDREGLKKQYADILDPKVQSDILYLMESDNVGTPKLRSGILKNIFGDKQQKYIDKKNASNLQYEKYMNTIENFLTEDQLKQALGGETNIKKFMRKQTDLLNEIFDTSELKKSGYAELIFNADHLEGIAEIARMEDAESMVRGLKNLMGTTAARNRELGMGGFSTKRRSLMDKINRGTNIDTNVSELNKITKEAYPQLKGDLIKYDPKTKSAIPTKNFTVEYDPDRAFGQYFTELAKNPKGAEQMIKQAAGSPELTKFIKDIEGGNFKNFNKVVSEYQKGKLEFGKELNFYCKVAGQRRLSTGMVPGATCSSADIERGMRIDSKTPEGKARLMKVAKNFGKVFGKIVAPIDIGIESAFALPHLLRGDVEGAIGATTAGLFGAGKEGMEQVGEKFGTDSPEYALYGAEDAVQQKMIAIGGLDKLLSQNRQLGIIPEESGEFKKGIGRQPQEEALKKTFTTSFINLAKLDQEATKNFEQYYPLTADITQRNKAIQNVRGLSDEIQSTGFFKNIKGPSDTKTIEGFLETAGGKSQYPLLPTFDIPALRAQATDYTGLDYLDRVSDMPTDVAAQVPEFEKEQIGRGVKEYAMKFGPRAAKEFFEAQGIETQPFLEGMQPGLFMKEGGRINLANGGRLTFAEGPEDPSKRKTLKKIGIGGGIAGGLMTGLINLMDLFKGGKKGVVATKAAESEIEKVYLDLINVVKNKGILKRLDSDLETKVGEVYEYKGVKVLEDGENIELRFETDQGAPAVVEYRKPGYEVDPETGTSQQVPGEFIYEAQEVGRYGPDGDVDLDYVEEIVDPIQNVTDMADEVFETYVYKSPANRVKKTNDK